MKSENGQLIIITGMSGAGKSTALRCFEDLGYCCVDNLPPDLIETFIQLYREQPERPGDVAVVCDVRSGELFDNFHSAIKHLAGRGLSYDIVFLDCEDSVLVTRFKESRRRPPLGSGLRLEEAVSMERQRLDPLIELATLVLDTSELTPQQLREQLLAKYADGSGKLALSVNVLSFGFKYGMPADADFIFDTRFLPNPYYVEELRDLTGNDGSVCDYVLADPDAGSFIANTLSMLKTVLPRYHDIHKYSTIIALGCTGGKHRSVCLANRIAKALEQSGHAVNLQHRDVSRL